MTAASVRALAPPGERVLVERARDGDRDAFTRLVEARVDGLFRTALAILRNEADANDAVQQACVSTWRELPRLRDPERFDAWLGRTLVNACRMSLRSSRRVQVREVSVEMPDGEPTPGLPSTTADADRVPQADAIRRAFDRLSADHRAVLVLHHVEERPIAELAPLLGIAPGTVKWRLHEARGALRRALEREDA